MYGSIRDLNGASLASRWWPKIGSLVIFQGDPYQYCKETLYFFVIYQGGSGPLVPPVALFMHNIIKTKQHAPSSSAIRLLNYINNKIFCNPLCRRAVKALPIIDLLPAGYISMGVYCRLLYICNKLKFYVLTYVISECDFNANKMVGNKTCSGDTSGSSYCQATREWVIVLIVGAISFLTLTNL